jgi:hypothetical protein
MRNVNLQFKLHKKKCESCNGLKYPITPFNPGENQASHIVMSKNGNPVYRPSTITYSNVNLLIGINPTSLHNHSE